MLVRTVSRPTIWWHETDRTTLILGAGQHEPELVQRARDSGIAVVKRSAGGTAVLAGSGVLGLDVAIPEGHPAALSDVVEAYRWLGEVWVECLTDLIIDCRLVSVAEARQTRFTRQWDRFVHMACFGAMSPYEVAQGDKKLVGLAQVRRKTGTLLQAGIHQHFDAYRLSLLLQPDDAAAIECALQKAAIGLEEAAGRRIDANSLMDAFARRVEARWQIVLAPDNWTDIERALATVN